MILSISSNLSIIIWVGGYYVLLVVVNSVLLLILFKYDDEKYDDFPFFGFLFYFAPDLHPKYLRHDVFVAIFFVVVVEISRKLTFYFCFCTWGQLMRRKLVDVTIQRGFHRKFVAGTLVLKFMVMPWFFEMTALPRQRRDYDL